MAELYRNRERAESFGSIARLYDRYRPTSAPEFLDELAALKPGRVLDVGCGTGKVARELMNRGLDVLGVELDPRMASIAREHGVEVEISGFETWDDRGRTFDLITCGDAWHWIDPIRGWRKVGRVLRPGGTVARFWNHYEVDEPLKSAFEAVIGRVAPELADVPTSRTATADDDPRVEHRVYPWVRTYSADEWVALAATYSAHQMLEPSTLAELQRALHAVIVEHGGTVVARGRTDVSRSRAMPR
ncbi:class I SAM-dependent methyltransferase [Solirubrobacter ginsenosidimutans]|uniref:Class I SAM-dependent methyltransferase n=1 Tax=Solirubrobacter ginsenosidimutans TaxID=490573 RepID=A0A9X3S6E6_9ACTN|nr:class I SAM-dependent methyltransferase [Solirubrobacter ginsenosidimutans]MDA0165076.1 class I SAM-dependent methyltransferase [Solirubrobacter ginsenosidimutans]